MHYKIVPTQNVINFDALSHSLITRQRGFPGMGLIEGQTGYGKTTAVTRFIVRVNGVYVRVNAASTKSGLLKSICEELQLPIKGTCDDLFKAAVEALTASQRPLFFDEADYLTEKKSFIEIVRDLHDMSEVAVVLIGMKGIRKNLLKYKQVTGRLAQYVEFQPNTFDDARLVAKTLCEVKIEDDLLESLHKETRGSMRLLVVGLGKIENTAKAKGLDKIGLTDWRGGTEFFVGNAPMVKI